jgi:hypothetical protein
VAGHEVAIRSWLEVKIPCARRSINRLVSAAEWDPREHSLDEARFRGVDGRVRVSKNDMVAFMVILRFSLWLGLVSCFGLQKSLCLLERRRLFRERGSANVKVLFAFRDRRSFSWEAPVFFWEALVSF